jgi:FkbM family methyltransferase
MRAYAIRSALRRVAAAVLSTLPRFRGKGRITLLIDRLVTNSDDPRSYITVGRVNGGGVMSFDLRGWGQKFAFYYGEWEPAHVRALRRLYRGGTFLDIGSSLGLYPVSLGRDVAACGGRIVAVEPVPLNLERQAVNLRLNGLESLVTVLPVGLGSADGELRISVDPTGADNNALISVEGNAVVPIRRLDDVVAELGIDDITLIKIDVEGFEPEVLKGGRETIRHMLPVIFAEFNRERMRINGFTMDESWDFLGSCGYRAYRLIGDRFEEVTAPGELEDLYFIPGALTAAYAGAAAAASALRSTRG